MGIIPRSIVYSFVRHSVACQHDLILFSFGPSHVSNIAKEKVFAEERTADSIVGECVAMVFGVGVGV